MKKALILLNMGGPNNLSEVEVFLKNMFNDPFILGVKSDFWRSVLASLIVKSRTASARSNYEKLGGRSPICSITAALCERVNELARAKFGAELKFENAASVSAANEPSQDVSSQSKPSQEAQTQNEAPQDEKPIDELICDYAMNYTPPFAEDVFKKYADFDEIILMPLYPHFSKTTVQSSLCSAEAALKRLGIKNYKTIDIFYDNAAYNEILLNLIPRAASRSFKIFTCAFTCAS